MASSTLTLDSKLIMRAKSEVANYKVMPSKDYIFNDHLYSLSKSHTWQKRINMAKKCKIFPFILSKIRKDPGPWEDELSPLYPVLLGQHAYEIQAVYIRLSGVSRK